MADLEIELPVDENGTFDYEAMKIWADFQERNDIVKKELEKIVNN